MALAVAVAAVTVAVAISAGRRRRRRRFVDCGWFCSMGGNGDGDGSRSGIAHDEGWNTGEGGSEDICGRSSLLLRVLSVVPF